MKPNVTFQKPNILSFIMIGISMMLMVAPLNAAEQPQRPEPGTQGKAVAMVIPYGRYNRYIHEEFVNACASRGVKMTIVSSQTGKAMPNKGTIPVKVGVTLEQVDMAVFDALVFAGGGALLTEFAKNPTTERVIQQAIKMDKVVAGLDLGKALLVRAGAIDYKLPDSSDAIGAAVTTNGKIITGNSTYVVLPFIDALFNALR